MPADVFFSVGEPSGDLQAALLVRAIRSTYPHVSFAAVGGRRLRAAGAQIVVDSSEWASIGPVSALGAVPALYFTMRRLKSMLHKDPPKLLVPVDFGAFNLRLLKGMRRSGYTGQALYYFPPGAWLDNAGQAQAVASTGTPLTPFEHQCNFYRRLGLNAEYFGHPLVSVLRTREFRPRRGQPHVLILPGSRREEVARHLPVLATAAERMRGAMQPTFTVVAASGARETQIRRLLGSRHPGHTLTVTTTGASDLLEHADLAWVASGTAVLEAALRGVPQIAFYTVSGIQYRIAQSRLPQLVSGNITLPNLVLGRTVIPELLQQGFTADRLVQQSLDLLGSEARRKAQFDACAELRAALGPVDALDKIAQFVAGKLELSASK